MGKVVGYEGQIVNHGTRGDDQIEVIEPVP